MPKKKKNTIIRPLFSIVKKQLTQFMSREDDVLKKGFKNGKVKRIYNKMTLKITAAAVN